MALNDLFDNRNQEIVPIKAERVFDSCSDKICLDNLPVTLDSGILPPQFTMVKCKNVWVENVCITIEPLNFNRGFFSVDTTYTFRVELCLYERPNSQPVKVFGTAYTSKNTVLYGSDIATQSFTTGEQNINVINDCNSYDNIVLPTATVQVAKPVVLDAKIGPYFWGGHHHHGEGCGCGCGGHKPPCPPPCPPPFAPPCPPPCPPPCANPGEPMPLNQNDFEGFNPGMPNPNTKLVFLTLGLFTVLELSRPVTVLAATYEYTIPTKECHSFTENPCCAFEKLNFPVDEFSPQSLPANSSNCGC